MPHLKINDDFQNELKDSIIRLLNYCKNKNWAGYDPFDGLNSKIFELMPFHSKKLPRLFFIQFMKHFPINLRPIILVPKEQNPKGLALFASSLIRLSDMGLIKDLGLIDAIIKKLIKLKSPNQKNYCWGYNFDWQNRGFFLPKFSPNIICTTFAANAVLDAYEKYSKTGYLDMAVSAGCFLISDLNRMEDESGLCFSYTQYDKNQVHNANLLGAAFLGRLYSVTGDKKFFDLALKAVEFSVKKQHEDGSWPYGERKAQRWVDNFHTGYNLIALKKFGQYTGNKNFTDSIQKGFQFYLKNFFTTDGLPKYYHNKLYPIDIHAIAQSIVTLVELSSFDEGAVDMAIRVYRWAIKNMQSKNGYFYYQQERFFKNKILYMRWSQAWMLYALAIFAQALRTESFVSSP